MATTIVIDHAARRGDAPRPRGTAPSLESVKMGPVTVNGVVIPRATIASEVQNFPAPTPAEAWQAAARALAIRELLLQEARRLGIAARQQADGEGRLETPEDALIRALTDQEVRTPLADAPTARRYYDNNPHRFTSAPLYEADHILIAARRDDPAAFQAARDRAAALAAELALHPDRFAALARECSACPSASLGGSLGQIGPGDTTAEFEAALKALDPGTISAPVQTRYGMHLIRLHRRIDGRTLPFEAVRERIESYLNRRVRHQATAQYIAVLAGKADIQGVALDGAASPLVQ